MIGLRVLEVSSSLAVAYCTRLLAAAGADVVCLEPPEGAALRRLGPWIRVDGDLEPRSATWEYAAAGKRSLALPIADADLDRLLRWADLVVSGFEGDADAALAFHRRVEAANPAAVHVVLSGYGLTGPFRNWRHSPLTEWAAGGHLYLTGEPDREPVQGGGPWTSYLTGTIGAIGAAAALFDSLSSGQGQLVDVGAMEAMASLHQWTITIYTHLGYVKRRWGNLLGESSHPIGLYRCSDGWISIVAVAPHQWEALCVAMELWALLADPALEVIAERFDRATEIDAQINEWLSTRTVDDAVAYLQGRNVPASRLLTMTDLLVEPQLDIRSFWARPDGLGAQARMPGQPFVIADLHPEWSAAPRVGEHGDQVLADLDEPRGPRPHLDLSTVRALEFGVAWAGPLAGRFLGDLGIDVIKVEHPSSRGRPVDASKTEGWTWGELPHPQVRFPIYPDNHPGERWWNRMGMWNKMNRSKRGVALDAKSGDGPEVLGDLIGAADLVLHNFSPRGAKSLGIDATAVAGRNPRTMTVSLTGYGVSGPLAGNVSYGPVLQAHGGFDESTGYEGGGPVRLGVAFPDAVGGVHGAFAALVALWNREVTGTARSVDVSQLETLLAIAGDMLLAASVSGENPERRGNRSVDFSPQNVYRAAGEDAWVAVTIRDDREWTALVALLESEELSSRRDQRREQRRADEDVIDAAISAWTAARPAPEAAALLQGAGVAAFPAMTNADLVADAHLTARRFIATWDQPDVGIRSFPGFPIHFQHAPVRIGPAPSLGADNVAVCSEVLGYDEDRIARLFAAGVLADRPPDL